MVARSASRLTRAGASKDIIEAPSLDVVRGLDARTNVSLAVDAGAAKGQRARGPRGLCQRGTTKVASRSLRVFVRHYPEQNPVLRDLLPSITTPTQNVVGRDACPCAVVEQRVPLTTSSPTARSIPLMLVTSRGSKHRRSTAACSPTG